MVVFRLCCVVRETIWKYYFSLNEMAYAVRQILFHNRGLLDQWYCIPYTLRCEIKIVMKECMEGGFVQVYMLLKDFYNGTKVGSQVYLDNCLDQALKDVDAQVLEVYLRNGVKIERINWKKNPIIGSVHDHRLKQVLKVLRMNGLDSSNVRTVLNNGTIADLIFYLLVDNFDDKDIMEIVEILVDCGMSINELGRHGDTALYTAVEWSRLELVSFLIEKGVDVNVETKHGELPLFGAVTSFCGDTSMIDLLLNNNVKINAKNRFGRTALHEACLNSRDERVISCLLRKGAYISDKDYNGVTPLSLLLVKRRKDNFDAFLIAMMKEFAVSNYENNVLSFSESDMIVILDNPKAQRYFECCMVELATTLYAQFSTYSLLKISKNKTRKLTKLFRNQEIVAKFQKNSTKIFYYQAEVKGIFEEVTHAKNSTEPTLRKLNHLSTKLNFFSNST